MERRERKQQQDDGGVRRLEKRPLIIRRPEYVKGMRKQSAKGRDDDGMGTNR